MILEINNINKSYNENVIFKDFNMKFYKNKVNCILGKSGCGKSTLLNIISGIIKNDSSKFETLEKFGISYIFQDDRLIDWLTVEENIRLIAKSYYKKHELDKEIHKYLSLVGIYDYKNYYPQMLSGGIRQRVNIARGLICPSNIIIMDEPFKSIDISNKKIIIDNFNDILKIEKRTVILVTHDIDEALYLGDKIFILGNRPIEIKATLDNSSSINKEDICRYIN
nr:ABC transporter ATP-binding protein [[Clostridium] dakarense]